MSHRSWHLAALAALLTVTACSSGSSGSGDDGSDPRTPPLPTPVTVRQQPENVTLADPRFDPLPGAKAEYGHLGGTVYQIEVPDHWNGRLVLWMHGFGEFGPEAKAGPPDLRAYLIAQGYAWAASSFSGNGWIPGRAVEETAALWDHFAATHGRPRQTYVMGASMGGAAGNIAAERHPERFDGVLALCGSAGARSGLQNPINVFVAGAFVAGVTQADYDAATDVGPLIRDRIRPALADPRRRDRFERIMVDLTGGPRPFDREGIRAEEETDWRRAELSVSAGVVPHHHAPYPFGPGALHLRTNDDLLRAYVAGNEATGHLRVPLLTMHTTGDGQVPIDDARILQQRVDRAGQQARLVQRVIRDPGHCGFTTTEVVDGFEALVAWVEHGTKPTGHDVLHDDLSALRPSFERQPRPGTPEADRVTGARHRVVVHGTATIDGKPLDASFFGAEVVRNGLTTPCQLALSAVTGGAFEMTVLAAPEAAGCGRRGSTIVFWTYVGSPDLTQLHSTHGLPWPGDGTTTSTHVAFSSRTPLGASKPMASFVGEVLDATGHYVPPGTPIEAYVGNARCAIATTHRTGSYSGYTLLVAGPDAVPGCAAGAPLSFRVNGRRAAQTTTNDTSRQGTTLDLTIRQ
jgi:pimeloyl-ACP methyl ester carboxylesterase